MRNSDKVFLFVMIMGLLVIASVPTIFAIGGAPEAEIINDEGGPTLITGEVAYTHAFFTQGVAEPLVILEDQAGFVDRDRGFLMPPESQVLGQITSDYFTSPFTYSLSLPIEPRGNLRDVDNNGEENTGVMIFAVAYWTNTFGDSYLEERDLYGGGWSTAYASTRVDQNPGAEGEYIGGKVLIYAPEEGQGFPVGFGDDGSLFTEDDPIVIVPLGYTIVDLEPEVFTFGRPRHAVINLIEGEGAEAADFSEMSYTEAFDAMIEKMRREYAFTEYKGIDWDALAEEFRPHFEEAEAAGDNYAYRRALMGFTWAIPDGHVATSAFPTDDFLYETDGGLGLAISELDNGRVLVNFLLEGAPADEAGIELRAEIFEINGAPIADALAAIVPWSSPFSAEHIRYLQQLRYVIRFPVDTEVELVYQNPGESEPTTATLTTVAERASFAVSSFFIGLTGVELPLEYQLLAGSYIYVKIFSFSDNELLTIQLWERLMQLLNQNDVSGLIIDMRQNGGGSGFLADQMAAYFFDEAHTLGNGGRYDEELGDFYFDPRTIDVFYPPPEELRYHGDVAVLIGPSCASACEFFSYDMTVDGRAAIIGQYPTMGLGGGKERFFMPDGEFVDFTVNRAVDNEGNIHIEGIGVAPTVRVPVNEETLFSEGDPVLEAAIAYLER